MSKIEDRCQVLHGSVLKYDRPTEPVGAEDWQVLSENAVEAMNLFMKNAPTTAVDLNLKSLKEDGRP